MLLLILLHNFNYIFLSFLLFRIMYFIYNHMKPNINYRIVLLALTLRNSAFCHSVFLFCNFATVCFYFVILPQCVFIL